MKGAILATAICSAALSASLVVAGPVAAEPSTIYRGVYHGVTTYTPNPGNPTACDVTTKQVTGNWMIRAAGDYAIATTNLFYDGNHHLAWGGKALDEFEVISTPTGADLAIQTDIFGSGTTVTMTVLPDDTITYVVEPYNLYGNDCASLTLTGTVLFQNGT